MKRFTLWSILLALLVLAVFNVQGWLVLRRTSRQLEQELGDRLQSVAQTLALELAGRYDSPDAARLLTAAMQANGLFNLFIVDETWTYVANARDSSRVGTADPALQLDEAELAAALSGIPSQSRLYSGRIGQRLGWIPESGAGGYVLKTAYVPLADSLGVPTAVLGAEADARYFRAVAGFRNSLLLTNGLSLLAVVAIVLLSLAMARRALFIEQAAARANTLALMGQISAAVAHEIKNPLAIILAATEQLRKRLSRERPDLTEEKAVQYIKDEVERLNRVLTNYLSLGSAKPAATEPVDLEELVGDVLTSVGPETRRLGIAVETSFADLPPVTASRLALRQVFLNLVLNSIQAQTVTSDEGRGAEKESSIVDCRLPIGGGRAARGEGRGASGLIRVTGTREEGGRLAVVRVEDAGPGIPPAQAKRVFDPFFTTREKGSGLGLFVVRRVVEEHRGSVALAPRPGGGTVVEVRLPV